MGYSIQQNQTSYPLLFLMVQSSDHISPLTGATPTVSLSKNGGAFASPAGAVSEVGSGWYKVAPNGTDANTLGPLKLHASATSGDPTDEDFMVVGFSSAALTAALTSAGLDAVLVESGITASSALTNDAGTQLTSVNARQALALALSILGGLLSGASGSTPATKPVGLPNGSPRYAPTIDGSDNRTAAAYKVPT